MHMRRIYLWIGLGGLMLALAAFILRPWNAQAAYGPNIPATTAASSTTGEADNYRPQGLDGVPLRESWWLRAPGVSFDPATKITQKLQAQLDSAGSQDTGFMIYLKAQANTANTVADWSAKGNYVLNLLEQVQQATQPAVLQAVSQQQALGNITGKVSTFTIINAIFVHGNAAAAQAIARLNDVAFIDADHVYHPMDSGQVQQALADTVNRVDASTSAPDTVELGVVTVHAPQAWAEGYRGTGVVVGSIDTGVQYTHPAVNSQYRGNLGGGNYDHNYNWWDARADAPRQNAPYDDAGHGTHTMGTVLGDDGGSNQIGVAPAAKWIAAKVFPNDGSSGNEEITPAEDFMIAPWDLNQQNRRPDLRPNIVTNSWGDDECWNTDSWLITQVWIDDGIMPAFANGNAGPGAGTVGSPGGYPFLVGVGAINAANFTIAGFSSRGPSCYGGALKPDVVAPGVNVRSSVPTNSYAVYSGTSMATPHVAGVMALVLNANPSLTYTDVMGILTRTAYFTSTWGARPNNNFGWGLVQADAAIEMAVHGPHVSGVVDGGSPIEGAHVTAVRQGNNDTYSVVTRASGAYSMTVLAGTYDVTVSAFGYDSATLNNQVWMTDTSPVLNVSLTPQTMYTLSGTLFENGTCTPLSGTVAIEPSNALVVHSDPITGLYTAQVPAGTYTLTARAGAGYQQIVDSVNVSGNTSHDFTFGPAYDSTYVVSKPAYNWIAGSTQLAFSDAEDGYVAVTLPFAFSFYTGTYTTLNVSTNGYATFNDFNYARMWANTNIPNPGPTPDHPNYSYPNNAIYPYWDDLAVEPRAYAYGDAYTGVSGTAPNRIFVIEWRGVAGTGAPVTFEIQLEETTNKITFEYQDIGGPYGFGYSATEGIEDANGVSAIQFGFNEPGIVGNNTAFSFTAGTPPTITQCTAPTPTVTVTPTACNISFEDVPVGSTFYPFIECLACRGIINGYPCGGPGEPCNPTNDPYFRPGNNVTRGQFAKIASNAAGFNEPPGAQQYEDVPVGSTFFDYVWRLSDRGYVTGYPCGGAGEPCGPNNLPYFRPNANVTRGQLSKIDSNAAGYNDTPGAQQYEDVPPGSTFYDFIWRLSDRSIINGYPCGGAGEPCGPNNLPYFRPGANATRGQASKIVSNTFFPACNVSLK